MLCRSLHRLFYCKYFIKTLPYVVFQAKLTCLKHIRIVLSFFKDFLWRLKKATNC